MRLAQPKFELSPFINLNRNVGCPLLFYPTEMWDVPFCFTPFILIPDRYAGRLNVILPGAVNSYKKHQGLANTWFANPWPGNFTCRRLPERSV